MSFIKDISEQRKELKKSDKSLRNFGFLFAVVFLIFSLLSFYKNHTAWHYLLPIAGIFLLVALTMPKILWELYKLWMTFSYVLGYFVSRIILSIIFFLVFTPMAFILKLIGKDLLNIKPQNVDSYWVNKDKSISDKLNYERMH